MFLKCLFAFFFKIYTIKEYLERNGDLWEQVLVLF